MNAIHARFFLPLNVKIDILHYKKSAVENSQQTQQALSLFILLFLALAFLGRAFLFCGFLNFERVGDAQMTASRGKHR